jgi:hypothetical protein
MGIDRIAMLKYGIPDLRAFFDSDLRWLRHYGFSALDMPDLPGGRCRNGRKRLLGNHQGNCARLPKIQDRATHRAEALNISTGNRKSRDFRARFPRGNRYPAAAARPAHRPVAKHPVSR